MAQFGTDAAAEHQGQRAQQRGHRRHQNRTEAQQARLVNRISRRLALIALRIERKVDHHDRVFLDDADQQNDADQANYPQVDAAEHQGHQRADAGRGQRRENRDRMNVALVQHAQHDVHGHERGEDQQRLVGQRGLKGFGRALEIGLNARRQAELVFGLRNRPHRRAQRFAAGQVEGDGDDGELSLVIHRQGGGGLLDARKRAQRRHAAAGGANVDVGQIFRPAVQLGLGFQHDAVLVQLREQDKYLPLAEGVVQRVVDHLRRDPQPRGGIAIDHHLGLQAFALLIAGHIAQFGQGLQLG